MTTVQLHIPPALHRVIKAITVHHDGSVVVEYMHAHRVIDIAVDDRVILPSPAYGPFEIQMRELTVRAEPVDAERSEDAIDVEFTDAPARGRRRLPAPDVARCECGRVDCDCDRQASEGDDE